MLCINNSSCCCITYCKLSLHCECTGDTHYKRLLPTFYVKDPSECFHISKICIKIPSSPLLDKEQLLFSFCTK